MTRHIVLLGGINIGARNRIAMPALRQLLADLGYTGIRTHLQSGNAILDADTPPDRTARAIRDALATQLTLNVPVVVRSADELAAVVAADPFDDIATDPARYLVRFHDSAPDPRLLGSVDAARYEPERHVLIDRELYLWLPNGVHSAKLPAALGKLDTGGVGTARNWRTVTALHRMSTE